MAVTCVAPFVLYPGVAHAQPVIIASETATSQTAVCPVVPAAQTTFGSTATNIWFDVAYTGENIGDEFQIGWYAPNGTLFYYTGLYVQPGTGTWCLWDNLPNT